MFVYKNQTKIQKIYKKQDYLAVWRLLSNYFLPAKYKNKVKNINNNSIYIFGLYLYNVQEHF